jgi:hypothetical protein
MSREHLRGVALLCIVFVAGAVAGVAGDRIATRGSPQSGRLTMRLPEVLDRLDLTGPQRRAVDSILTQSSPRSEAAMREMVPRLAAIADSAYADLASVLTPAQRARLDSMAPSPLFLLKRKSPDGTQVDTVFRR